jgi:hypothetical protein
MKPNLVVQVVAVLAKETAEQGLLVRGSQVVTAILIPLAVLVVAVRLLLVRIQLAQKAAEMVVRVRTLSLAGSL